MEPTQLDNVLVEILPMMRRINVRSCEESKIAHPRGKHPAVPVEIDSLLANILRGAARDTGRQVSPLWILFGIQGVFNILLIWRMFRA